MGSITIQPPFPHPVQDTPARLCQGISSDIAKAHRVADEICNIVKERREENAKLKEENFILRQLYINKPASPPKDQA